MTLEQYIAAWNQRYKDCIVADLVRCIRKGCDKKGDELIVPDDTLYELPKCPNHDEYWILTPRYSHSRYDRLKANV
jgi:hypothetical protein